MLKNLSPTLGPPLDYLDSHFAVIHLEEAQMCRDFLWHVLSSTNLNNPHCPLYVLYQFVLQQPVINTGGRLLPDLINAYNWLHDNLAYTITREHSEGKGLKDVLEHHATSFRDKKSDNVAKFEKVLGIQQQHFNNLCSNFKATIHDATFVLRLYSTTHRPHWSCSI